MFPDSGFWEKRIVGRGKEGKTGQSLVKTEQSWQCPDKWAKKQEGTNDDIKQGWQRERRKVYVLLIIYFQPDIEIGIELYKHYTNVLSTWSVSDKCADESWLSNTVIIIMHDILAWGYPCGSLGIWLGMLSLPVNLSIKFE